MTYSMVWFKRDLPLHDHAPLIEATVHRLLLRLFVIEPKNRSYPLLNQRKPWAGACTFAGTMRHRPQLNPEERLNADLKQEMSKRVPVRTKAKIRQAVTEHMTMLEQMPERVIAYYQCRHVKYAA